MALHGAHLRVARPTDNIDALVPFYRDGLGFKILLRFGSHEGFDGVMLGLPGEAYHLEFITKAGHVFGKAPSHEHLLVFYLPGQGKYEAAVARMEQSGVSPVTSFNPYWDRHGKTYEDPDGNRVVLANMKNPAG
jgi:catechol 2,3-dioxygenase-like lactoylglutathione lyase family enzyme